MIEFLLSFPGDAPIDAALVLATAIYALFAYRVLAAANKRDSRHGERLRYWQAVFEEAARRRNDKRRPSPAE